MEDLRDKVFQTHNEVTIRDGRKLIVIRNKLLDVNGIYTSAQKNYDQNLITNIRYSQEYDIMKVYNPIKKEVIFDRKNFIDWSNVAVDTKILVSDDGVNWIRGYFAKYEDGEVSAYINGSTSWSNECGVYCKWEYAKLADE